MTDKVETKVKVKASANLQKDVEKELTLPDPEKVKAADLVQDTKEPK